MVLPSTDVPFIVDVNDHSKERDRVERVPKQLFTVHVPGRHVQGRFTREGRGCHEILSLNFI